MQAGIRNIKHYMEGIALSYAQIYFNKKVWPGIALMLLTFFDLKMGVAGLTAIIVCQLCSTFFHFDKAYIYDGTYTYNSLLVGLAMGSLYQPGLSFFILLAIASLLTFFLTIWVAGKLSLQNLPFLTLPFLVVLWVLLLGLSGFNGLKPADTASIFLYDKWPQVFNAVTNLIDAFAVRDFVHLYLRSLSAILFQYNDLAGLVIAIVLLGRSRMAFMLSLYGFLMGYLFYAYFEGNFTTIIYSYIGFNFILTAIALGGFFVVPSRQSHLLLLFIIPLTVLILSATNTVFTKLGLPIYSLPFNIIVILTLSVLQMRPRSGGLQLVLYQQYSPELNHYKSVYYDKRFAGHTYYQLFLPVIGEWHIPQGHEGAITHKEGWQHALDFDVRNDEGKTYRDPGTYLNDYYCYELPVVAAAAGQVIKIMDGIYDNQVKEVNLKENWGNTIIIKHADGLYTKLSHLKHGTFKVKEGDYVHRGELLALCGSTGRSPEPHLHFQVQANPYIGSQTISYPLAYYLVKQQEQYVFHSFDIPGENEVVRNIVSNPLLAKAFDLVPGKEIIWEIMEGDKLRQDRWFVYVDVYNRKYLYCNETKAAAYFTNDGTLFYFTDFYGSKKSFLYTFYLSFQKVLLGCYPGVTITDWLLPQAFIDPVTSFVQDILAPFFHFADGIYQFRFGQVDNYLSPAAIPIETYGYGKLLGRKIKGITANMLVTPQGITSVAISSTSKIKATCANWL